MQYEDSLFRIVTSDENVTVGTGFVASRQGLLVTCSHVVQNVEQQRNTPHPDKVRLEFHRHENQVFEAQVIRWLPWGQGDLALLRLDGVLPPRVVAVRFGLFSADTRCEFRTSGFPNADRSIEHALGVIAGRTENDIAPSALQLVEAQDVTGGFSGSPVVDLKSRRVVGVISYIREPDRSGRRPNQAFAIASELLFGFEELKAAAASAERQRRLRVYAAIAASVVLVLVLAVIAIIPPALASRAIEEAKQLAASPMISFPPGRALLGVNNSSVYVPAFSIDKYEVSYSQYQVCVENKGCQPNPRFNFADEPPGDPVGNVTAYEAALFCDWLEKRLPSAAEWERAARGTEGNTFPWGNDPPDQDKIKVNMPVEMLVGESDDLQYPSSAVPVQDERYAGSDTPDGLRHMVGNVREWTSSPATCDDTCTSSELWNGKSSIGGSLRLMGASYRTGLLVIENGNLTSPFYIGDDAYAASATAREIGFRCAR